MTIQEPNGSVGEWPAVEPLFIAGWSRKSVFASATYGRVFEQSRSKTGDFLNGHRGAPPGHCSKSRDFLNTLAPANRRNWMNALKTYVELEVNIRRSREAWDVGMVIAAGVGVEPTASWMMQCWNGCRDG